MPKEQLRRDLARVVRDPRVEAIRGEAPAGRGDHRGPRGPRLPVDPAERGLDRRSLSLREGRQAAPQGLV